MNQNPPTMNVIYLCTDTFRYDNVFGPDPLPTRTPYLDAFAAKSTVMDNMIMGSFPTVPQRTDVFTGRFGWPRYGWQHIDKSSPNRLAALFAQQGYATQLLCDCPHLFSNGFNQSFHGAEAVRGQEGDTHFLHLNDPIEEVMPPQKTRSGNHFEGRNLIDLHSWINHRRHYEGDLFMAQTATRAMQWLEDNHKHDSFFLWVDFFDPHEPWDPPEYMVKRYDPDYAGTPMLHPNYGRADDLTPDELQNLAAHYYAESELVDRWIGRIIEKIDDLELRENTLVVIISDHGMSLGEHNRTGKSNINDNDDRYWPTYPEVAHELLMIAGPGITPGRRLNLIAQPPDIAPTLMDFCSVDTEPPEPMHGRSFAPQLRGEAADELRDVAICASFLGPVCYDQVPNKAVTPTVYTHDWVYVPVGPEGQEELYDRKTDRLAATNVIADHMDVAADMRGRLAAWLKEHDAPDGLEETLLNPAGKKS